MAPTADIEAIRNGASLHVVLRPNPARPGVVALVESMALPNVFIKGGQMLGASAYAHAWHYDRDQADPLHTVAYAYNNFCDLVFNVSLGMGGFVRGIHAKLYESIRFVVRRDFEKIWEGGKDASVEPVRRAVDEGRTFKVVMEDFDGLTVVHPVHLIEVRLKQDFFMAFTVQTAFPAIFRRHDLIGELARRTCGSLEFMEKGQGGAGPAQPMEFNLDAPQFESGYYIVNHLGAAARGASIMGDPQYQRCKSVAIYAALPPA